MKVGNAAFPVDERAMTRPAKRITSTDVARAAGVSQTTVSFVLNDKPGHSIPEATRLRILEVARQLDYRPHGSARALAAGRSDIVLLSVPDLPIGGGISRFIEEMAAALADQGLTLVTHLAGAHGRPLADVCATVNASAVIGFTSFDEDTVQALYRAGADVVLPSRIPQSDAGHPVGRLQAEHLIGRGHRRIGYAMPAHPGLREMAEGRLEGAMDACAAPASTAGRAQREPGDRRGRSGRGGMGEPVRDRPCAPSMTRPRSRCSPACGSTVSLLRATSPSSESTTSPPRAWRLRRSPRSASTCARRAEGGPR